MMIAVRTVLCPVDFSDVTARQVALAADLARLYGARLVLHHNMASLSPGAGVGWMWSADQAPLSAEAVGSRLGDLAATHAPDSEVELRITEGPASTSVIAVSNAIDADVVVLTTHHAATDDHPSVTATVLEHTHRSVIALHDTAVEANALRLDSGSGEPQVVLVPIDLTPESLGAVDLAFQLARAVPIELHLIHFLQRGARQHGDHPPASDAEAKLHALVPPELLERTHVHVRDGDPERGIVAAATEFNAACIVMGEHTRALFRRWFSRNTSAGVLHDAPCPVWYVPGAVAA